MVQLPIEQALPPLREALGRHQAAVLVAAPGAGKTTRVPLALMDEPWLSGQKIVMLEPRRLAARSAAAFMARQLGEKVGETVGYRVRMETKVGPRTRVEVVTEGVLTRMLQADQALHGVGLVIFDEYHERSLHADLGLALCLQTQAILREDLRLLVMSATLDAQPVARLLGDVPVVASEGRTYPVETLYRPAARAWPSLFDAMAKTVLEAVYNYDGDALVFLPGMSEIRLVERKLRGGQFGVIPPQTEIHILYGSMPQDAQDRTVSPATPGKRKIVLSTSVAESSLTVEGVTIVIDSGLQRVSRFSPRTGMSRLDTVPVSQASADQRRGRAGRLQPGVCYRTWTEEEHNRLPSRTAPEIQEADLAPLLLELAVWGVNEPDELAWLDPPPKPALQQAQELLTRLGALSAEGTVTEEGQRMARIGVHPRLAHMLLRSAQIGLEELACELAVVLSERDNATRPAKGSVTPQPSADVRLRVEALRGQYTDSADQMDDNVRRRLHQEAAKLKRELHAVVGSNAGNLPSDATALFRHRHASGAATGGKEDDADELSRCGLLLAFAYPDRIARRRENGKYILSGGRGAELREGEPLAREQWLVAADIEDAGTDGRIRLAASLRWTDVEAYGGDWIVEEKSVFWDGESQAVRARTRKSIGAIAVSETVLSNPPIELVHLALLEGIRQEGMDMLPWTKPARQLQERIVFLRATDPSLPDLGDEALLASLESWLLTALDARMKGRNDLQRLNMKELLEAGVPWDRRRELDAEAPTHWIAPTGTRLPIDYGDPRAPFVAVRLQELFGLPDTPRIARGRVPLTLHLLSPAQRPVQVTRDLANFWRDTYFEVRKDLRGRYPKHYWPDNPLEAEATRRAKPRQ